MRLLSIVLLVVAVGCTPPAKCVKSHFETVYVPEEPMTVMPRMGFDGNLTLDIDYGHAAYTYQREVCDLYEGHERLEQ